ncbi:glycoside hydrolase family 88 protein [Parabacteroides sp. OttesenSCG-928-N08]|nr:glycoside hydrolase family 88 protein [Parabacteroides sp. OttesenSCG-928-N08]
MKKKLIPLILASGILLSGCQVNNEEKLASVIQRGLTVSTEHALNMAKELESQEGRLPKTLKPDGTLETSNYGWWCSGFFPGELWYLYENNSTAELKRYAEMYTDRVEPAKKLTGTHDLGFMLNCSFGNGYRLTQNPRYLEIMTEGAHSLATRYQPHLELIRSWDFNRDRWQYPVIIDNMMNLEFFTSVSRMTGDQQFAEIANKHAMKTMEHHFRPDYSSYHVISYDTISGMPHIKQTHQGLADESAWARGQAWGLYGYVSMYRETGKKAYLNQALHIAAFMMNHPTMPEDKVPYWDFDDPKIPEVPRDASAAAIMASALIELSQLVEDGTGQLYLDYAIAQVRSLSSPDYLAEPGTNGNFAIMHCTGHLPGNSEVDVPLSYADYYYVEALMRLKQLNLK